MLKLKTLFFLLFGFILAGHQALAQDYYNFTQFFVNPSLINPSLTGIDGQPALFISYKKQWSGLEGSPTIGNLNFQTALANRLNLGINVNSDQNGLLNTSSLFITAGYTLPIATDKMIRFGLSFGAGWTMIDANSIKFGSATTDPVMSSLLNSSFQSLGNMGLSYHSKAFHFGVSVPNIFAPSYLNKDQFTLTKVNPFESIIAHTSYRIYFANDKNVFEPYLIYRYNQSRPPQIEAAGVLHLQNAVWIGGSYKQDFGIGALAGLKINKVMAVGYSYTLKNTGANQLSFPSHEIQIGILFGKHKTDRISYSFVNTEKEKPHKTHQQQLAEQKKHEAELARKQELERQQEQARQEELARQEKEKELARQKEVERQQEEQQLAAQREQERQAARELEIEQHRRDSAAAAQLAIQEQQAAEAKPERHETVQKGDHVRELAEGHYVIAGVFSSETNANNFKSKLVKMGIPGTNFGYLSRKGLWYVHIFASDDINKARAERDKFRKLATFSEAWLLTVER